MSEEPSGPIRPRGGRRLDSVPEGIGLTLFLHVGAAIVASVLFMYSTSSQYALILAALGIGVTQLIWIVPAILVGLRVGRQELVKGLIIGAAITFLLNGACWALVWPQGLRDLFR